MPKSPMRIPEITTLGRHTCVRDRFSANYTQTLKFRTILGPECDVITMSEEGESAAQGKQASAQLSSHGDAAVRAHGDAHSDADATTEHDVGYPAEDAATAHTTEDLSDSAPPVSADEWPCLSSLRAFARILLPLPVSRSPSGSQVVPLLYAYAADVPMFDGTEVWWRDQVYFACCWPPPFSGSEEPLRRVYRVHSVLTRCQFGVVALGVEQTEVAGGEGGFTEDQSSRRVVLKLMRRSHVELQPGQRARRRWRLSENCGDDEWATDPGVSGGPTLEDPVTEVKAAWHLRHHRRHAPCTSIVDVKPLVRTAGWVVGVMEYLEGQDLVSNFEQHARGWYFDEVATRSVMIGVLTALHRMHELGMAHRDVALENVLLRTRLHGGAPLEAVMIDFGMVCDVPRRSDAGGDPYAFAAARQGQRCGHMYAMAPEVWFMGPGGTAPQADMWSAGIIASTCLYGEKHWQCVGDGKLWFHFKRHGLASMLSASGLEGEVSDAAVDFMSRLLQIAPGDRMTAHEALAHPWLSGGVARPIRVARELVRWATFESAASGETARRPAVRAAAVSAADACGLPPDDGEDGDRADAHVADGSGGAACAPPSSA